MIKQCSIHGLLTSMLLIVFSLMSNDAIAQKAIRGTVLDEANEPIIGASVLVKGTTNGSITGVDGTFNVKANPSDVLVISYVGYATVEQQVGNQTQLVIHLREDSKVLNDVVVIGYGSTTKKELTGSVTSMKKDDLNPGTFTNAMGMLQGKVAGLQIINPNGADPTAKYEVLLRGTNTLSAGQGPLIIIDGVAGADIRNINFQEVESIDVLKDGSAAAIYGTRGTNGVIIVTTKRARSGKTEVSYDGQLTVGVVSRRAKPLSASEYKSVIKEYRPELESYIFDSDTDWFKEITQTPFSHKHNLSISGGSEKFSHHTSFNYEKSDGLQKHNSSEKLMARTNIRQSLLDKWVDLDYNLNIIHRKYSPSSTSAFMQAFTHNPTEPVYDDSDPDAGGYSRIKAMEYYNPVAIINERNMESKNDNYGANIRATLNILPIKGLKWENFVSYDKEQYETREYYTHYYPSLIGTNGQAYIQNYQENDTQYESTLNYSNIFGKHSIQALLGYTYQYTYSTSASMTNSGFDFDDNQTHNIGTGTNLTEGKASMSSNKEDNTYIGFFGRFMYNYDDKYLLSASLRRDGSSRFGDNNKWGWFPAVSVGWRINKEKFLSNVKWIDDLKLRAGYGVTGNQDFSNYKSLMMMTTAGKFYYNGQWINTYQPASNANPDLKWETVAKADIGIHAVFFERLTLEVDYYNQRTKDMIFDVPLSYTTGFGSILKNVGEMENKGIEFLINANVLRNKDFSWDVRFTGTANKNKIIKLATEKPIENTLTIRKVGEAYNTFYMPEYAGVDPETGEAMWYKGQEGDEKTKNVNEAGQRIVGSADPKFYGGFGMNFKYKGFDFSFDTSFTLGNKVYNSGFAFDMQVGHYFLGPVSNYVYDNRWQKPGDITDVPKFVAGDNSGAETNSSRFLMNGSYLRMKSMVLGYTLPKNLMNKVAIDNLRVYISADNLFTITAKDFIGFDPQTRSTGMQSWAYPVPRNIMFGLNLSF